MASPKTWELLTSFETCLAEVTMANGYYTDAGLFVTREPAQIPANQPALIAVILESLGRAEAEAMRGIGRLATVLVIGKVSTEQTDAQIRLHELIDDIQRAFFNRQDAFPAGTQLPRFVDARLIPPAEGMSWIGAEVRFSAHVRVR